MAGPIPPYPPVGSEGQPPVRQPEPYPYPDRGPAPFPGPPFSGPPFSGPPFSGPPFSGTPLSGPPLPGYPDALPPPVGYSATPGRPAGRRPLWWALAGLLTVALVVAAVLVGGMGRGSGDFTDAAAQKAIQNYLNALSEKDTETVARNTACGMFDALKDRKSDLALARLASDAFGRQFSRAEVTSIDKIVLSSSYQAQVLFTMRVAPATGARNARDEQQGVAQLLRQGDQLLVCSYLLRTAAQY